MTEVSFIRQQEVLATRIPVSKSAYNQGIKTGRYPAPVKLSERTAAYRKSDIDLCCLMLSEGFVWRERNDEAWLKRKAEIESVEVA